MEFISGKKLNTTIKLNPKLATVQRLMANPRIFNGRISETKIQQSGQYFMIKAYMVQMLVLLLRQPMGPRLIAKEAIYKTTLPTAIHLRLSPNTSE